MNNKQGGDVIFMKNKKETDISKIGKRVVSICLTLSLIFSILTMGITAASSAEISQKNYLKGLMVYYERYAQRVILPENKQNQEYINYVDNLLPQARILTEEDGYRTVSEYVQMEQALENSWNTWREQLPVSVGVYKMRDEIMRTVKDQSQYDSQKWKIYSESLKAIIQLIDGIKNSLYATDKQGVDVLNLLQCIVDGLEGDVVLYNEDILAKLHLYDGIDYWRTEVLRDTKETKSPETTELIRRINEAQELIASQVSNIDECNRHFDSTWLYCDNVFKEALCIGQPFIKKARDAYYKVAKDSNLYTVESWNRVSAAINQCDAVYPKGTDAQCREAYEVLISSISKLELKPKKNIEITVSDVTGKPGETVNIDIVVGSGSDMIYGNFNLYYDDTLLEFVSADKVNAVNGDSSVFFRYDNLNPVTNKTCIASLVFRIKDNAEKIKSPLKLKTEKLRDKYNSLFNSTVTNGSVSINSSMVKGNVTQSGFLTTNDARMVLLNSSGLKKLDEQQMLLADYNGDGKVTVADAQKILVRAIGGEDYINVSFDLQGGVGQSSGIGGYKYTNCETPEIPVKKGYIFKGWYTKENGLGKKVEDSLYLCKDMKLYANWEKFEPGPMTKDKIEIGGWCAVHVRFAVEDDFKMIAENGISFILMDYTHGDSQSQKCIEWAEKYGIKVYVHDYSLNSYSSASLTPSMVLELTEPYRNSPAFAGNDLIDEPGSGSFAELGRIVDIYKKALPEYDMHINLFPDYAFSNINIFKNYIGSYIDNINSDHICTDSYPFSMANQNKITYSGYYNGMNVTAKAARDNNLDHWEYLQTISGMGNGCFVDITDLRFQYYTCLAFGASKLMHFTYDVPNYTGDPNQYSAEVYGMRDYGHNYTQTWDYAQIVNNEVLAFSEEFSMYNYKNTYTYRKGTVPEYVKYIEAYSGSDLKSISSNTSLLIGLFEAKQGNGKAFLIANASDVSGLTYATVSFEIPNAKNVTAFVDGQKMTLTKSGSLYQISLKPGAGAYLTVEY